jgi:5-methylcytosine-specific restriction protein A
MPERPARSRRESTGFSKREHRPSSGRRGYGRKWQTYAKGFLAKHPLCRHCEQAGRIKAAECVDHIQRVTGPEDSLFWKPVNHQPLCWTCHGRKTVAETRSTPKR